MICYDFLLKCTILVVEPSYKNEEFGSQTSSHIFFPFYFFCMCVSIFLLSIVLSDDLPLPLSFILDEILNFFFQSIYIDFF